MSIVVAQTFKPDVKFLKKGKVSTTATLSSGAVISVCVDGLDLSRNEFLTAISLSPEASYEEVICAEIGLLQAVLEDLKFNFAEIEELPPAKIGYGWVVFFKVNSSDDTILSFELKKRNGTYSAFLRRSSSERAVITPFPKTGKTITEVVTALFAQSS
ncbi:MAG: hypothetical protein OXR68_07765 [Alphaproteobacteria bacterium]|nr:hypothetical protein [Alphaproteobacteria bacterium]MDD9920501.1 hypothetical protein [Alphaproteobacteria bacterium]